MQWHWIELPPDVIDASGRYEVEFQYSSGENALHILGVAAMRGDDNLIEVRSYHGMGAQRCAGGCVCIVLVFVSVNLFICHHPT